MTLLDRWKQRWRSATADGVSSSAAGPTPASEPPELPANTLELTVEAVPGRIVLDLERTLEHEFPEEFKAADAAKTQVIAPLASADLAPLAKRSPSLAGYQWEHYLRCSLCRVVRAQRGLRRFVPSGSRVLDYGSYFGNFALAAQGSGYKVEAVDSYAGYDGALDPWVRLQRDAGIVVHDFADVQYDMRGLASPTFDAVICAGVIEHMPHTPRPLLETLNAILKPGGVLLLDTPNLGYLYRRLQLLEGRSIFPLIEHQYFTEIPFEGHHREYTVPEVEWLLGQAGHTMLDLETFNYSVFGNSEVSGEHVEYFHAMASDPLLREIIFTASRRP